ncbi:MAG: hypothetical protein COB76_01140 [Alphaproteobacteria bacterium]|nr:MAG: hypothetical protein COB76_01140 [Alphaproteobacteria bacterium]
MKINTSLDYFNYTTHLTTAAVLFGGATLMIGSPILSTLAIGGALGVRCLLMPVLKDHFRDNLPPAQNEILDAKIRAGVIGDKHVDTYRNTLNMSKKMGFKTMPRMHFYMSRNAQDHTSSFLEQEFVKVASRFVPILERASKAKSIKGALSKMFLKYANAAAFSHVKQRVIYSEPLIKHLKQGEIDGVSAHELCHLKAKHINAKEDTSFLTSAASATASLNFIVTAFSSISNFAVFGVSTAASMCVMSLYKKAKGYNSNDGENENKRELMEVARVQKAAGMATLGALAYMTDSQALLFALGLNVVVSQAGALIKSSLSRRHEFHADRIAGDVTKHPENLISGLRAARDHNVSFEPGMEKTVEQKETMMGKIFASAVNLYASHPPVKQREKALKKQSASLRKQNIHAQSAPV